MLGRESPESGLEGKEAFQRPSATFKRKSRRLSPKELACVHKELPPDSNGDVSRGQLEAVLKDKLGMDDDAVRQRAMAALIEQLDPHHTGRIFLPDFVVNAMLADDKQEGTFTAEPPSEKEAMHLLNLLSREECDQDPRALADEAFDLLDWKGLGKLDQEEVERLLTYSGAYDSSELSTAASQFLTEMINDDEDGLTREAFAKGVVHGQVC